MLCFAIDIFEGTICGGAFVWVRRALGDAAGSLVLGPLRVNELEPSNGELKELYMKLDFSVGILLEVSGTTGFEGLIGFCEIILLGSWLS